MKVNGMDHFNAICKKELVKYFNEHREQKITEENTFIVWSCKTLQNYKALASTDVIGDTTYVEFTFNGDKGQLYMDVYTKEKNVCIEDAPC